jgi:DNA-binding transcriptional LysR family regulator
MAAVHKCRTAEMFDWNDLRYFLAVAEHGSTLAAGRAMRVSQTTVARRIAALEQSLGVELFERLQSGYTLTDIGEELLNHARKAGSHAEALHSAASAKTRSVTGTVRITVEDVYSVTVLAPIMRELREAHPDLRIDLDTTSEVRSLAAGEADVAIRSCVTPDDPNIVGRRLFPDNFSFYCSKDYAAAHGMPGGPDELGAHALIAGGGGGIERAYDGWLRSKGLMGSVVMHTGSATGLLSAVKSGAGIAALPCIVAEREPGLIRCYPPARDNSSFMWLLTHERLRHAPRVRAVMDFLYLRLRKLAV